MNTIMMVTGPIPSGQLGPTSMHEYLPADSDLFADTYGSIMPSPANPSSMEDLIIDALADFKHAGGENLLDYSVPGIGRNVLALMRISQKTGIGIVASTGLFYEDSWPDKYKEMSVDTFVTLMKDEIEHGIRETDIKAGHITTAVDKLTARQYDFLKAVARTSNETGVLVTAKMGITTNEEDRRLVYKIFLNEGIAPERLLMCDHDVCLGENNLKAFTSDPGSWKPNLDYLREVLDKGINICMDGSGMSWGGEAAGEIFPQHYIRMVALNTLIQEGYTSQLVLCANIFHKIMTKHNGKYKDSEPMINKARISKKTILKITIDNPACMLSIRS